MRLIILYGSQTGTAQDVAEQIWRESKQYGFVGPVLPLDEYPIDQLTSEHLAVFVVATTGNGDEPENMRQTWKFLLRRSLPRDSLQYLQYACLGLGDSSYSKFNFAAKKLNKRLQQLGAKELQPIGLCDDQHDHGLSAVTLPWIKGLWRTLKTRFSLPACDESSSTTIMKYQLEILRDVEHTAAVVDEISLRWPYRKPPLKCVLKSNERTTSPQHFQDVRLLQFEYPVGTTWQPGDVFDIRPCNSDSDVSKFFDIVAEYKLDFTPDTIVTITAAFDDVTVPISYSKPVAVSHLVKYVWDLNCKPRQRAFELLAVNCTDELEREKLLEFTTAEGLDDLINYINRPRRTLLEVLQEFRNATSKLTLPILCEMFSLIQTRSFSIASVLDAADGTLDLLVAVVEYKTKLSTPRLGLCSNWLKNLTVGSTVFGDIKPGTMSLPTNRQTPLIMIGPGTGIAPFRSIIQHKELESSQDSEKAGKILVFFGCRNQKMDFHFEKDFKRWQSSNLIAAFFAFSRDQDHKIYVQNLITQNKETLRKLLMEENAVILVSGSANNMPKAVREAFIEVVDGDEEYIEKLTKTRRYQEETWS